MDIELEKYIIEKCFQGKYINKHWRKYISEKESAYFKEKFKDEYRSDYESIFMLKYNINKIPRCKICGDKCQFIGGSKLYKIHCGKQECSQKLNILHSKETCLKKYANANYRNVQKAKITCLKKYGTEFTFQSDLIKHKIKETKIKKYNNSKYNNIDKCKKTCFKKYGVENVFQNSEIKNKIKKIKKEKYNNENYTNREQFKITCSYLYNGCGGASSYILNKMKNTCIEKYGYPSYMTTNEFKQLSIDGSIKKYGVKYPAQSKLFWDNYNFKEAKYKEYITKKKNNSFNKSKPEDICYMLIKEKYPDVIRQYRSDKYPFNCDFYIPLIDTYIEYQGSDLHGYHPFDSNNIDDINKLTELKERAGKLKNESGRNKTRYDYVIYTWTDLDIRKREIAKENLLNFIEFWNIEEVNKWLQNI